MQFSLHPFLSIRHPLQLIFLSEHEQISNSKKCELKLYQTQSISDPQENKTKSKRDLKGTDETKIDGEEIGGKK